MFDLWPWGYNCPQPYQIKYLWNVLPWGLRKEATVYEPNMLCGLNIPLTARKVSTTSTVFKVFLLPVLCILALIFVS